MDLLAAYGGSVDANGGGGSTLFVRSPRSIFLFADRYAHSPVLFWAFNATLASASSSRRSRASTSSVAGRSMSRNRRADASRVSYWTPSFLCAPAFLLGSSSVVSVDRTAARNARDDAATPRPRG